MNITPNEIDTIEDIGILNSSPVKMLRTKGGFFMAIGKDVNKNIDSVLAAGSHPAIVKHSLEKQFAGFQPSLMKSEAGTNPAVVDKYTQHLSESLQKSGHDIYSIQNGAFIEFQITKQNIKIGSAMATLEKGELVIGKIDMSKEFVSAMANATAEKAFSCGTSKVRVQGK